MTFAPGNENKFLEVFNASKEKIRAFEGCEKLELLRDVNSPNIFFTHSHWQSENNLSAYRHSDLFNETWAKTKPLFEKSAEAWSLSSEYKL